MRKIILVVALTSAVTAAGFTLAAQAQPYGGYGPGYGMMGGYGPGWMHGGYGPGFMHGGYGYGMMGAYGDNDDRGYRRGPGYRGERRCWKDTDSSRGYGYYAPCGK